MERRTVRGAAAAAFTAPGAAASAHGAQLTNRRSLLKASAATWLSAASLPMAKAQNPTSRVTLLGISPGSPGVERFRSRLGELGWVEHKNLVLETRFTQGDGSRVAPLTAELLALRPDVFVASLDTLAIAAAASTATVPIVFAAGIDPVAYGLVKSLSHPGRNVTGFTVGGIELGQKSLSLLKEAVPGLKVVGVLVGIRDRYKVEYLEEARRHLGLALVQFELSRPDDIDEAFQSFAKAGANGVLDFSSTPSTFDVRDRLAALAVQYRLPMSVLSGQADAGGLLSYGPNIPDLFRRAAGLVDRILRGAKPADIPVEQANVHDLVINLRTARALGVTVPQSVLLRATRVIE
ncbi:ABC transporter substrate-binding protein [Aquincola sp. S2]|uniref:ABC transporter substrate-binding protein n=1 Tax=Pseudaquabacterium terrae TaxID=2732868 RepID=A0ABX2EBM8_9BURK|nr:ABC transporter substrate-binding protein [Aquabacterium terrae]NRF65804.1 ABC transporter substrate-binding protein [Aquabacterium terrae]